MTLTQFPPFVLHHKDSPHIQAREFLALLILHLIHNEVILSFKTSNLSLFLLLGQSFSDPVKKSIHFLLLLFSILTTPFVKDDLENFVLICCLSFVKLVNCFIGPCPQIGHIPFGVWNSGEVGAVVVHQQPSRTTFNSLW